MIDEKTINDLQHLFHIEFYLPIEFHRQGVNKSLAILQNHSDNKTTNSQKYTIKKHPYQRGEINEKLGGKKVPVTKYGNTLIIFLYTFRSCIRNLHPLFAIY